MALVSSRACNVSSLLTSRGAFETHLLLTAAIVVLTWYYYAHARWVEVWLYTAKAMRYAVPMGLNVTSTHGPLLRSWAMPSILAPPKDHIEVSLTSAAGDCGEPGEN